jgi:hypothetical protein
VLAAAGARHIRTPPYTPRWNGKVERFIGTLQQEWAYARTWRNSSERARSLLSLDIRDVESFTGRIVERSKLHLDHSDREDLHAFLVAECWLLSTRYSPGGISFSSLAGATLRLRVVDWQRQRFGRTRWTFKNGREHVRERPKLVSLDADDSLSDRLDESLAARSGDPSADSPTDLERLLEGGDREAARDIAAMGL